MLQQSYMFFGIIKNERKKKMHVYIYFKCCNSSYNVVVVVGALHIFLFKFGVEHNCFDHRVHLPKAK